MKFSPGDSKLARERTGTIFQTESNQEYGGLSELEQIEQNLPGYNADIVSKLSQHMLGRKQVLEFGAGIGTLALEWERQTRVKPECLEIDPRQQAIIQERGLVCYRSASEITKRFDGIYTSNVLEHIENDTATLQQLSTLLVERGLLAIYVPAFMCLFSDTDQSLGHYRRYRRADLICKVVQAGFEVVHCQYVDVLGFFAWYASKWLNRRIQRKSPVPGGRHLRIIGEFAAV
jgi:predicted SAM-dependent methyltransferase